MVLENGGACQGDAGFTRRKKRKKNGQMNVSFHLLTQMLGKTFGGIHTNALVACAYTRDEHLTASRKKSKKSNWCYSFNRKDEKLIEHFFFKAVV